MMFHSVVRFLTIVFAARAFKFMFDSGSIQDIQYDEEYDTSFPVHTTVEATSAIPEIYSRSLLSAEHGFDMNQIVGNRARPKAHL